MRRTCVAWVLAVCAVGAAATPASAYLHLSSTVRGQTAPIKWRQSPVRWFSSTADAPGVTAAQFQAAVNAAFGTWEAVPSATIAFQYGGFTSARPWSVKPPSPPPPRFSPSPVAAVPRT